MLSRLVLAVTTCVLPALSQTQTFSSYPFNVAPYTRGATTNFSFATPEASPDLAKGQCFNSATYYNPVCKATNFSDTSPSQQEIRPYYSTFQAVNSDGSLASFVDGNGDMLIYKSQGWSLFRIANDVNLGEGADPRWDTSGYNPRRIFFHDYYGNGCRFYRYDVSTDGTSATKTVIHDFGNEFPGCIGLDLGGTGTSSTDTRYWAFTIRANQKTSPCTTTSTDVTAMIVYDMNANLIAGKLDLAKYTALGGSATTWNNCSSGSVYSTTNYRPDAVDISPLGTKVMINWPRTNTGLFGDGAWVMNKDFSGGAVKVGSHDVHYGWAFDAAGNELVVSQHDGSHPVAAVGPYDGIVGININTGVAVKLIDQGDYAYGSAHIARITNPSIRGWALVSTYRDITTTSNPFDHHILMVETKDWSQNPRIWRVAEPHDRYPTGPNAVSINDPSYSREPHASLTADGQSIFFGADWLTSISGKPGSYSVNSVGMANAFYVSLPPGWWSLLGGSGTVTVPTTGTAPTPTPAPAAPTTTAFTPIRVNTGGPSFTDSMGQVWSADTGYSSGTTYATTSSIANTTAAKLYQSERYQSGGLSYTFAVPNGTYTVNLKFAEIWFTQKGQRVFNASINGQQVLSNFDIIAAAGTAYRAIDKPSTVNVTTGQIVIQFTSVIENPKVNAIEITASTTLAPPPVAVRINSGGAGYTDNSGLVWAADTGHSGGGTYFTQSYIANTNNPNLYQTERYQQGGFSYTFTVPNGTYSVKLKFAEIWFTSTGKRVFNVSINGQQVLSNFDIVAAAGGAFTALDKAFPTSATNGSITISFAAVVENPKVNGIEIVSQ